MDNPTPNQPTNQTGGNNIGVGTPNIGVEKTPLSSPRQPQVTTPAPTPPPPPQVQPPVTQPPVTPVPPPTPPPPPTLPAPSEPPAPPPSPSDQTPAPPPEEKQAIKIEVADYSETEEPPALKSEIPPLPSKPPVQVKDYQNQTLPQPPIKAATNRSFVAWTIIALILGSGLGFFGFRYWDKIKLFASTEKTPEVAVAESPTLDVNTWKIYDSTLYSFSLKYPSGWPISTTDPQAQSLVIASNQESLDAAPTGYKIEITFQSANEQTLRTWVETNTAARAEVTKAKEITVSGATAYQQELAQGGSQVATYIERPGKIMIVTYSAPETLFGQGGDWYNNLINSIKLM